MEEHTNTTTGDPSGCESPGPVRRRLGRGLNALLGGGNDRSDTHETNNDLNEIDVAAIEPNPFQPRKDFEPASLNELVDSIKQHGVLQPLLVRAHGRGYQLIAGERRWLASKQAGLETVPCLVLELNDQRVCEVAIEENLKRKDLNVLEKAQAFQDYLGRFGSSIEELAKQLSLNRSTVSNYLRLLELPDAVKQSLRTDKITNGHARALLSLDETDQIALCRRIESESLSVRKTEEAVREIGQREADGTATVPFLTDGEKPSEPQLSNHVLSLQQQLCDHLGTKVQIRVRGKDAGRIIIHFNSNDEFERIVRQLRRAA